MTVMLKYGTDKTSAASRGQSAIGQMAALQVTARGPVRLGIVTGWSMSGGDVGGWLVHYLIEWNGRTYRRSEEVVAL